MKILITGSSGYLGQHLLHYLFSNKLQDIAFPGNENVIIVAAYGSLESFGDTVISPVPIVASSRSSTSTTDETSSCRTMSVEKIGGVNLADPSSTHDLLIRTGPPDVLIHLAAVSSLADCENNPKNAMAVNCPTSLLAQLPAHCKIIFLSSDQVYDGTNAPYTEETSIPKPVNTYGSSKLAMEQVLMQSSSTSYHHYQHRCVVLRSSLILGPKTPEKCRKQSFVQFAHDALVDPNKKPTSIFTDEYRSVIFVNDVIRILLWFAFANNGNNVHTYCGIYNMGGPKGVTRFDIVREIASAYDLDMSHILPMKRSSLIPPSDIKSPADITMDITKLSSVTGLQMTSLSDLIKLCSL
mmetsp:Transcript_4212/g.6227  ORF Transcript_4212/g.6227 Transcript_4212/m.6227 type:complete len:353 (-) Transcript_4212:739-1797(-)